MPNKIVAGAARNYSGAMPQFYVQFVTDRLDPYPPLAAMRQFEGETPMAAVEQVLRVMPPPLENDSEGFWAREVIEIENGSPKRALSIPMVCEATVPIDFGLPAEGGGKLPPMCRPPTISACPSAARGVNCARRAVQ